MKINTKQTFNNEAQIYEQTSRAVNIFFDKALNFLVENTNLRKKNPRILDVCCGTGILTESVAKKYPAAEIVGVDFSNEMLKIATERLKKFQFIPYCFDILETDKMACLGKFDLIVSSFGVHNVHGKKNKQIAINNIVNALKAGGKFITCDILKGKTKSECEHFREYQYQHLLKSYSQKDAKNWMALLDEEDDPETFATNEKLLIAAGAKDVKLLWQKEFLAIWTAKK